MWIKDEIAFINNETMDFSAQAFIKKREKMKQASQRDRLKHLDPLNHDIGPYFCFNMLLEKIFDKSILAMDETEQMDMTNEEYDKHIEFLLKSITDQNLVKEWRLLLSDEGLKVLRKYVPYVDYALHNQGLSLLDFLNQRQIKNEDASEDLVDSNPRSKMQELEEGRKERDPHMYHQHICVQLFDIYVEGEEKDDSSWNYTFSRDLENSKHSFNKIVEELGSNPQNFQDGTLPDNLSQQIETIFNKEKHYFAFLKRHFYFIYDENYTSQEKNIMLMLMAKILLNDKDPDLQGKSYGERQHIFGDFLRDCIAYSKNCSLEGITKQDLKGNQQFLHSYEDDCDDENGCQIGLPNSTCIKQKLDIPTYENDLFYQFLLSISPHHKTAKETLEEWCYIAHELLSELIRYNKYVFCRYFREQEKLQGDMVWYKKHEHGGPLSRMSCKEKIGDFIKKNAYLFEEDTLSKDESSKAQVTNSLDTIALLFETALKYYEQIEIENDSICEYSNENDKHLSLGDQYINLTNFYEKKKEQIDNEIAQEEQEIEKLLSQKKQDLSE